jgi:ABC-type amino acid transport substrate-binding protein
MTHRVAVLALVAAAVLWGRAALADTLKFGNEGTYPPFSLLAPDGKLTGMEPDVAREMCKRMNAECEIVTMDFKALIPSMLQGKLDGITSQITPTPERVGKVLFSRVILQNNFRFVCRRIRITPSPRKG